MFEEFWKEYCVKHGIMVGSAFETGMRLTAEDAYCAGQFYGVKKIAKELSK